jgi:hypothetical protein
MLGSLLAIFAASCASAYFTQRAQDFHAVGTSIVQHLEPRFERTLLRASFADSLSIRSIGSTWMRSLETNGVFAMCVLLCVVLCEFAILRRGVGRAAPSRWRSVIRLFGSHASRSAIVLYLAVFTLSSFAESRNMWQSHWEMGKYASILPRCVTSAAILAICVSVLTMLRSAKDVQCAPWAWCVTCGYTKDGLARDASCPECGRVVPPSPALVRPAPPMKSAPIAIAYAVAALLCLFVGVYSFHKVSPKSQAGGLRPVIREASAPTFLSVRRGRCVLLQVAEDRWILFANNPKRPDEQEEIIIIELSTGSIDRTPQNVTIGVCCAPSQDMRYAWTPGTIKPIVVFKNQDWQSVSVYIWNLQNVYNIKNLPADEVLTPAVLTGTASLPSLSTSPNPDQSAMPHAEVLVWKP